MGMRTGLVVAVGALVAVGLGIPTGLGSADAVPDTSPPTAPQVLSLAHRTPGVVTVQWSKSTDDVDVARYEVLRNGVVVDTVINDELARLEDTLFGGPSDAPQGDGWFQVQAVDTSGNVSRRSAPERIYVDNTRPSAPREFRVDSYDSMSGCLALSYGYRDDDIRPIRVGLRFQTGATLESFFPTPDSAIGPDRFDGEACVDPDGGVYWLQLEANGGSFGTSVKTPPVKFQATARNSPRGFRVDPGTAGGWTASWDAPSSKVGATKFVVLNRLEPIAEVDADQRTVNLDLDPNRTHWLQLITIDQWGNESRRTAPIRIDPEPAGPPAGAGVINGQVWTDRNGDGLRNNNEPAAAGIQVTVSDADSTTTIDTVASGGDGRYRFEGLDTSRCYLVSIATGDQVPTLFDVGNDNSIDSDIDADGTSRRICFGTDVTQRVVDAGVVPAGFDTAPRVTLNVQMFWDANLNGTQDPGETNLRAGSIAARADTEDVPGVPVDELGRAIEFLSPQDNGRVSLTFDFLNFDDGARCNTLVFVWSAVGGTPPEEIPRVSSASIPFLANGEGTDARGQLCIGSPGERIPGPLLGADPYTLDVTVAYAGPDPEL